MDLSETMRAMAGRLLAELRASDGVDLVSGAEVAPPVAPDTPEAYALSSRNCTDGSGVAARAAGSILYAIAPHEAAQAAGNMMASLVREIQPGSAIERMLVEQMVVIHAQMLRLQSMASKSKDPVELQLLLTASSRLTGDFRRSLGTLMDCRRPPGPRMTATQVNLANQQIVLTNELGSNGG